MDFLSRPSGKMSERQRKKGEEIARPGEERIFWARGNGRKGVEKG
jgi:hypothetical protein